MKTWIKISLGIWIAAVLAFGIAMPIGDIPGLGSKARIIFFHVPMSWLAVLAFFMSMWYGITYLRKKEIKFDIKSAAAAELGFIFSVLATSPAQSGQSSTGGASGTGIQERPQFLCCS